MGHQGRDGTKIAHTQPSRERWNQDSSHTAIKGEMEPRQLTHRHLTYINMEGKRTLKQRIMHGAEKHEGIE